eukprot:1145582-Pelagomonas_calceolata.AAC.8
MESPPVGEARSASDARALYLCILQKEAAAARYESTASPTWSPCSESCTAASGMKKQMLALSVSFMPCGPFSAYSAPVLGGSRWEAPKVK